MFAAVVTVPFIDVVLACTADVMPVSCVESVLVEDEIAPARIANQFAKTQENLKILGGIFEKRFIDKTKVLELANIPSRNELLGRLVGSIYSPVSSFVRVLNKIAEK